MKRIIEFETSYTLSYETKLSLEFIGEKFQAIDENFHNIEFSCQQFKDNKLQGEYTYKLPKSILKSATVNLDSANDEFYIELSAPVTVRETDGFKVQGITLSIEVVTEGVAEDNDSDFIGASKFKALNEAGDYKVGEVNSYYKKLGTVQSGIYYYREL